MQRLGRYTLVRSLAQGGMAEVFHARTEGPGGFEKDVALKRILNQLQAAEGAEGFAELFMDEARIAARLTHPNVVQVFDFGEADGSYYLAMELLDGVDLSAVLRILRRAGASMPLDVAVHTIAEAAAGLHYAHTLTDSDGSPLRLVHRDVSPSNLFLTRHGEVKVLDFGIAKAEGQLHITNAGTLKGKHAYVPPEQIHGLELTAQADIWALGLTLFELCTGVRFFQRPTPLATLRAVLDEELPPLSSMRPEAPEALDAIIRRCVAKDLNERYASCADVRADLQELVGTAAGRDMIASFVRYVRDLESGRTATPPASSPLRPPTARTPLPVFPTPPQTPSPFTPPPTQSSLDGESSGVFERGVRGTLDQLAIPDVVQMIEMGKRSAVVHVWPAEGEAGRLEFERGQLRYAVVGPHVSDEAFFHLCGAKQGSFHLVYGAPSGAVNVTSPTSFLLLEAMRRLDEASDAYAPDDDPSLDFDVIPDGDAKGAPAPSVETSAPSPSAPVGNVAAHTLAESVPPPAAPPSTPAPFAASPFTAAPFAPDPFAPDPFAPAPLAPLPTAPAPSAPASVVPPPFEADAPRTTLKALLARTGPLPAAAAVLIVRDALRSIAARFGDGRVATSTIVLERGQALLDTEHDDDDDARRAAYESPEEAAGKSLDMRSRLFSTATLAVEMLTGQNPFLRATAFDTREALAEGTRPLVLERAGGAPVLFASLLERMWRSAPEERPQTPAEAIAVLEPLARRIEVLYPNLLSRLALDPEGTARELSTEQARKDVELAETLARGDTDERRRACLALLRARAACPDDARAGARLLRMGQEEGWFVTGPLSSSLKSLVENVTRAPYDVGLLHTLREEAFDEGRFLHVVAALVRLSLLSPDDEEVTQALTSLVDDPGAPFGLEEVPALPVASVAAPIAPVPSPAARPSLPPVEPLLPPPARVPTPATVPMTLPSALSAPPSNATSTTDAVEASRSLPASSLRLPPSTPLPVPPRTPLPSVPETTPTAGMPAAPSFEAPLLAEEPQPPRRAAALIGVVGAVALALVSWFLWLGPGAEASAPAGSALASAEAPPSLPSSALEERQRAALDEAMPLLFQGEPAAAVRALAAVVEMAPESLTSLEARFALAQAHVRAGNTAAAAEAYKAVMARTPEDDERHQRAARLLDGLPPL